MKKEEIDIKDIQRILFGEAPPIFLVEVFLRALIVYIAVIIVTRWLGKRMNSQLTILEFGIMVSMGAILSVPMEMPDRGILQGLLALLCTLVFLRGVSWLGFLSGKFEDVVQGHFSILVKDGILQLDEMRKSRVSREQVFSTLRRNNVYQLGKVKRLYFEACGRFSVYEGEDKKPGLSTIPGGDKKYLEEQKRTGQQVCASCGLLPPEGNDGKNCANCHSSEWAQAVE